MANVKITELTAATALAGTDVLPIVDVGADATKKVSVSDLLRNLPDGTASAPALAFADDQNTGVLSPGNNSLAFATSGTQRLVIDSSGNVGIGTTSPASGRKLHVSGTGTSVQIDSSNTSNLIKFTNSAASVGFIGYQSDNLVFYTNNSEQLRIDSSGRVGIGLSSPGGMLHIKTPAGVSGSENTVKGLVLQENSFSSANLLELQNSVGGAITAFDQAGKLGIGTTSPINALHINGAANNVASRIRISSTEGSGLTLRAESATASMINVDSSENLLFGVGGSEVARIDSSGRVGIGTASATDLLTIGGVASPRFGIQSSTTGGDGGIEFGDPSDDNIGFIVYDHSANALRFGANVSERMRIDSSGRLSAGNTSASSMNSAMNNFVLGSGSGSEGMVIYSGSSDSGFIGFNDAASASTQGVIEYNHDGNYMGFRTADAERMRVDSSGRLLVGLTGSKGSDRLLQVASTGSAAGLEVIRYTTSASSAPSVTISRSNSDTLGTNTLVDNGDAVGYLQFKAAHGSGYNTAAQIYTEIDGSPNTNDMPGRLILATTADGASSPTERVRINSSGVTNIHRTTGSQQLRIGTLDGSSFEDNENTMQVYGHSATDFIQLRGCNTADGTPSLEIKVNSVRSIEIEADGDIFNVNGTYGTISDARLKENIVDASSQWDDVKDLQVRNFNFTEASGLPTNTQIGFVAQEVEQVSPGLVKTNPDLDQDGNDLGTTTKAVKTSVLLIKAIKALQEAMDRIETLETKVAALEA